MKYVIAKPRRLVIVHQYASMCDGQPCIRTDAEHTLECMTDERQHKYRVRRLAHGSVLFQRRRRTRASYVYSGCLAWYNCSVLKLKFHGTDTDTDTDTNFLADFRARILARGSRRVRRSRKSTRAEPRPFSSPDLSADFCPTRAFPREDVLWRCARVHVYVYCT